jgi:hypothetical protein
MDVPRHSLEAVAITAKVRPIHNIVQHSWIRIENRVHKADWTLAIYSPFLIQLR